jgi:hypothetical protein
MFSDEVDIFEVKAEELITEAMRLSKKSDAAVKLPQQEGSIHYLMQFAVAIFVAATKMVIILFRRHAKMV